MIKSKKIFISGISTGLGKSLCSILSQNNNKIYSLGRSNIKNKNKNIKYEKCNLKKLVALSLIKKLIDKIDYVFLNAEF